MRVRWDIETCICSWRGHTTPAARVARLDPEDADLGVDLPDGRRFARCLRCGAWLLTTRPQSPEREELPPVEQLPLPRRGKALREALVLRLIALERAAHSVLFGLAAIGLTVLVLRLQAVQAQVRALLARIEVVLGESGQQASRSFLVRQLQHLLNLRRHSLELLAVTAAAYCLVEGVEAVGLWHERRWAEYLTAVATAGFLPFEIEELTKRVSMFRLLALVINLAVLAWLIWAKHLFGLRRGGNSAAMDQAALTREGSRSPS